MWRCNQKGTITERCHDSGPYTVRQAIILSAVYDPLHAAVNIDQPNSPPLTISNEYRISYRSP
jgi:hypothetical protein